jgi:hypothetical protein
MDTFLSIASSIIQGVVAFLGGWIAVKPLAKARHKVGIVVFATLGLSGIGVTWLQAHRAAVAKEESNAAEARAQEDRTRMLEKQTRIHDDIRGIAAELSAITGRSGSITNAPPDLSADMESIKRGIAELKGLANPKSGYLVPRISKQEKNRGGWLTEIAFDRSPGSWDSSLASELKLKMSGPYQSAGTSGFGWVFTSMWTPQETDPKMRDRGEYGFGTTNVPIADVVVRMKSSQPLQIVNWEVHPPGRPTQYHPM